MTKRVRLSSPSMAAAAAAAWMVAAAPALAVEVETLKAKTRAVEIEFSIDRSILAEPKLGRTVKADAARDMAKWKRQAAAEYRENREFFQDGRFWSFEKSVSEVFRSDRHLSLLTTLSTYTGGAHGNTGFATTNWDRRRGKVFKIGDILAETAKDGPAMTALAAGLRRGVLAEKKARGVVLEGDGETVALALPADPAGLPPFTLEPSTEPGKAAGLTFHIDPYRVGSYAEGTYLSFVPWGDVAEHLRPDWKDVFGGDKKPD